MLAFAKKYVMVKDVHIICSITMQYTLSNESMQGRSMIMNLITLSYTAQAKLVRSYKCNISTFSHGENLEVVLLVGRIQYFFSALLEKMNRVQVQSSFLSHVLGPIYDKNITSLFKLLPNPYLLQK